MNQEMKFVIDILFLSSTFVLMAIFRKRIASWFLRIPLGLFAIYVISSIPFILIEENVNCLSSGCMIIPPTIPFLVLFIVILGLFVRWQKSRKVMPALLAFSLFGILVEYTIGASSEQLRSLPPLFGAFMFFWVGLSYAYISLVPLVTLTTKKSV